MDTGRVGGHPARGCSPVLPPALFGYLTQGAREGMSAAETVASWDALRLVPPGAARRALSSGRHHAAGDPGRPPAGYRSSSQPPCKGWCIRKARLRWLAEPPELGRRWWSRATPGTTFARSAKPELTGGCRSTCPRTALWRRRCWPGPSRQVPGLWYSPWTRRWSAPSTVPRSGMRSPPSSSGSPSVPDTSLLGSANAQDLRPQDIALASRTNRTARRRQGRAARRRSQALRLGRGFCDLGVQPRRPPARPRARHRVGTTPGSRGARRGCRGVRRPLSPHGDAPAACRRPGRSGQGSGIPRPRTPWSGQTADVIATTRRGVDRPRRSPLASVPTPEAAGRKADRPARSRR